MKKKTKKAAVTIVLLLVICIGMSFPISTTHKTAQSTEVTAYRSGWAWLDTQVKKLTKKNIVELYQEGAHTYGKMANGRYLCDGNSYKYRLEIRGTMHNAAAESTFVYLSNIEDIPFERAWKAAGFSSDTSDYFPVKEAVFIDMK